MWYISTLVVYTYTCASKQQCEHKAGILKIGIHNLALSEIQNYIPVCALKSWYAKLTEVVYSLGNIGFEYVPVPKVGGRDPPHVVL